MNENEIIFVISCLIIGAIIYIFFLSKSAVIKNKITKTPQKKIGDVKDGEIISTTGKIVLAGRHLVAPLSKRACSYYRVIVKDNSTHKELFKNYIDILEEKKADVIIFDGEHYAIIDTKLLSSHVVIDESQTSGFWSSTSDELKDFLKKRGERTSDYIGMSLDLYAEEAVLEEGEKIRVAGKGSWRDPKDFRLKISAKKILYLQPLNEHGVYLTDDQY